MNQNLPTLTTVLRALRQRILAGEDVIGNRITASTPAHGAEEQTVVDVDREHNRLTVRSPRSDWTGPILPPQRSEANREHAASRRRLERQLVADGLPRCVWRIRQRDP